MEINIKDEKTDDTKILIIKNSKYINFIKQIFYTYFFFIYVYAEKKLKIKQIAIYVIQIERISV